MAIHGWCAACSSSRPDDDPDDPAHPPAGDARRRRGRRGRRGVAAHYGDPLREQRLLTEGLAAVDLSHRGVVTGDGPDRLFWLNSITIQMLTGLAPLVAAESLVLSPKSHIEHDLHLVDDGETT